MTVAILVAGLPPDAIGGAEIQASEAARRLASSHDVRVYTRTATVPDTLAALSRCRVIQRSRVTIRGLRFAFDLMVTLARLWRDRGAIDVILAYQSVIDGLIAVLARRLTGIPAIVSIRSALEYDFATVRQARLAAPYVLRHADLVTVQSARMRDDLLASIAGRIPAGALASLKDRLCILPNGVGPTDTVPAHAAGTDIDVLFVGRLERVKGAHLLLAALGRYPHLTLVIVGDGPERPLLERAAAGLPHVTFVGKVPPEDVSRYMARAKVLAVPSLQEGQPNVALEAMIRGVPVVASRVGALPDVIRDGETGLLVEPGDVPALADAIHRVVSDAPLRARLSMSCTNAVAPYSWPRVIDVLEATLRRAAANDHRRRH